MTFNVLTLTLRNFISVFSAGSSRVTGAAHAILGGLILIDVVLMGFWWALDGGDRVSAVFKKILHIGFWIWLVGAFPSVAKSFVDSLIQVGQLAGGGAGGVSLLMDPSQLAGYGLDVTEPLVKKIADLGITDIGKLLIFAVCYFAILACYFVMAIHVFLGVLEYYLIVGLVGIFLPFGVLPSTKFLAEKAIGAVVAVAIKLMTLSFIVAAIQPVLASGLKFSSPDIPLNEVFAVVLTVAALAFVTWKAPSLAASLMSGTPNLGAGDIASPVMAAAGAAVGTAMAIKTGGASYAATKAASGAASSAAGAAGKAASVAGKAPQPASGGAGPTSSSPAGSSSAAASPGAAAASSAPSGGGANRTLVMSSQQASGSQASPQITASRGASPAAGRSAPSTQSMPARPGAATEPSAPSPPPPSSFRPVPQPERQPIMEKLTWKPQGEADTPYRRARQEWDATPRKRHRPREELAARLLRESRPGPAVHLRDDLSRQSPQGGAAHHPGRRGRCPHLSRAHCAERAPVRAERGHAPLPPPTLR